MRMPMKFALAVLALGAVTLGHAGLTVRAAMPQGQGTDGPAIEVADAPVVTAGVPGVSGCLRFLELSYHHRVGRVASKASIARAAICAAGFGYGVSGWYTRTAYYQNNFNRILNQCWPNCSNGQVIRMTLGLP